MTSGLLDEVLHSDPDLRPLVLFYGPGLSLLPGPERSGVFTIVLCVTHHLIIYSETLKNWITVQWIQNQQDFTGPKI